MTTPTDKQFMSVDTGLAQTSPKLLDPIAEEATRDIYAAIRILQQRASDVCHVPLLASEDIVAGSLVAVFTSGGVCKMRKANATDNTKVAVGYVLTDVLTDGWAVVRTTGLCPLKSSLTAGSHYYLSDSVSGGVTATKPTGTGKIVQPVGFAVNSTDLILNISLQYTQL